MKKNLIVSMMMFIPFIAFSQNTKDVVVVKDSIIRGDVFDPKEEIIQTPNTQSSDLKVDLSQEPEDVIYTAVEVEAEFPGGKDKLMNYLATNLKYPQGAKENGVKGKVIISFVVGIDGTISNIIILRDIGYGCAEEAVRVVKTMPKWEPAKQRGKAVRYQYVLPVTFNLR